MKLPVLTFLLLMTTAVTLTFGGMIMMDQHTMMDRGSCAMGTCSDTSATDQDMTACIAHCLQANTLNSHAPINTTIRAILLFVVAILCVRQLNPKMVDRYFRSDNDIGKYFLHRQLATVMIRD